MIEHEPSELEMILEQEQPQEVVLREIEHPENAHYFFNPELVEVPRAIADIQRETPAERDARYQRDLDRLEVEEAICRQRHEDKEEPVLPKLSWDL